MLSPRRRAPDGATSDRDPAAARRPPRWTRPRSVTEAIDRPIVRSAYTELVHDEPPTEPPALSSIPVIAAPAPEPLAEMRKMDQLDATLDGTESADAGSAGEEPVEGLEEAGEEMIETLGGSLGEEEPEEEELEEEEGRGGSRGSRRRRGGPDEAGAGDAVTARPPPLPRTGRAVLPRTTPQIAVRAPPYAAVADLPRPDPARHGESEDSGAGGAAERARASYAAAVQAGKSFYDELVGTAREIVAATEREARQAYEHLDADLALAMQILGITLSKRLGSNDQERDRALARLQALASGLRRRIRAAASTAQGRLTAMKEVYDNETSEPRAKRTSLPGKVNDALSDNMIARWDAEDSLDDFVANPGSYLTDGDFADEGQGPWETKAMREAAIEFVGPYAEADKTAIGTREDVLYDRLSPLANCLPCQIDTAFMTLDARMDYFMVAGPRSVLNAQNGAIAGVDGLVEQMTLTIVEAHASTAEQLVQQHDQTRDMLIQMAAMQHSAETQQMEAGGRQLADVLTAIAGSQTRGLEASRAELAKAADQPPGIYASAVMSGSARLKANLDGMAKSYPDPQRQIAQRAASQRGVQRRQTERERERALDDFDRALAESIRQTYDQLHASTEREFQRMAGVPAQVRSTCDENLARAEEARTTDVDNLKSAINDLEDRVDATIAGTAPPSNDGEEEGDEAETPPPDTDASTDTDGSGSGEGGEPMPPPASCAGCEQEETETTPTEEEGPGEEDGAGEAEAETETEAPDGTSGEGDNYFSSPDFRTYANDVTADPTKADSTGAFVERVKTQVSNTLTTRTNDCWTALDYSWRQPNIPGLMAALTGLTPTSGKALEERYGGGNLRRGINVKFDHMYTRTLAGTDTIEWNRNAALDALDGDPAGAALNGLRASINYTNEDGRIRGILQNLTAAQLAQIPDSELDEIAADLDGENLERFNALRRGDGGMERAITLRDAINSANMRHGIDRGRAIQEAVANARNSGGARFEGDPNHAMADIFSLEHPEAVAARRDALWRSTLENFADLRQVQSTLHYQQADADPTGLAPQLSDEQRRERSRTPFRHDANFSEGRTNTELEDIMLRYAAADLRYAGSRRTGPSATPPRPPPGYRGESSGVADRPGRLPPDMVNWIEQTIRHGPDSAQERGARMLVEFNRAESRGSAERFEDALHIGTADAVEGGGYAPRDDAGAQAARDAALTEFARYRTALNGEEQFVGPIDPRSVENDLRERFSTALENDPAAKALALGIIAGEHGDPVAAVEYAIDRGKKDMALRYLRRMDRRQIDAMMEQYDADHPNGPSLYQRLGLFEHHGMGASLSGDDALELEIAVMGVSQNDREAFEVSLRRMDQQIEHSTGAGQTVAADEFARLEGNRNALLQLAGLRGGDIDSRGRIRLEDADGNPVNLGNFNEDGSFRPRPGASRAHFMRAVAMGQITAENFTQAVDAAANFLVTALMVIAAVVITIATAGAASILLPMLLTAAIGLAGVGMTWALKGGRYSRDDLIRDLANVAVQTLVAGVGAAAGLYMRAGAAGGKAVTTMLGRLSMGEAQLATRLGMRELAKLTLRQELMLGALSGVLSNVGGAMADPRAWREGRVGEEMWHGLWRGAMSGMISSAAMRPMGRLAPTAGIGTQMAARATLNGVGNAASKAWDLAYDSNRGAYRGSLGDALGEITSAGMQGMVQGGLEAGGERFGDRSGISRRFQNSEGGEPAAPPAARAPTEALPTVPVEDPAMPRPTGMGIDENGALVPHALMHDDTDGPGLRTGDRDEPGGRRALPEPANDNPGGLPHQIAALSNFDMLSMPKAMEGAVFVHPDSRNLMAANDNFGRLINADPTREVAVHFNPVTGEYVVVQGNKNSVAVILPGGELSGPGAGGRLVSVDGVPDPQGYWIVHSHFHPNRPGETGTALLRRLPSGFGGDFGVIHFESVGLSQGDRSSRIYFSDEGRVAFTDFGITPDHPDGKYWIDFPHPQTGERVRRNFHTPMDYADFVKRVRSDPSAATEPVGGGGLRTADVGDDTGVLRKGSSETQPTEGDRRAVRGLADEVSSLAEHRRAVDILRERGASDATVAEARRWAGEAEAATRSLVDQLGLVGEAQSMDRLHLIMNDTTLSPELRQAIGDAVLQATREHMIAAGHLDADEPLMLLFHGAPIGRARSMAAGGIDLARVSSGHGDDFGGGLYLTSGVANAERYATKFGQERGAIFPFIMRRRDMGNVVDVRPGGPHRAAWEGFVANNYHMFAEGVATPGMREALMAGRQPAFADLDGHGNRGQVFEAFLAHLSLQTGDPRLGRPDLVLGELGGPFTSGVGHGDQQAARTTVVSDVLNSQMGSRIVPETEPAPLPVALKHDDAEGEAVSGVDDAEAALARQAGEDIERAFAASFDRSLPPETEAQAQQRAAREAERTEATNDAIGAAVRAFISADGPDRMRQLQGRVLRKVMASAPEAAGAILRSLGMGTAEGGGRVLSAAQEAALVREMTAGGMPPALAERYARAFGSIVDAKGPLHRSIATAVERTMWADSTGGLQQRAEAALDRRLVLLAARQFAERVGRESAGPRFKEIFRKDEAAVMAFLTSTAPMQERMRDFMRARRVAGANADEVAGGVRSLVATLRDSGLQQTIDRWQERYRQAGITVDDLDQLVRDHPDVLLMTARATPDQLAEFLARRITELLPDTEAGNRNIQALEFIASFVRGQETNVKALFSELEAVRMLTGIPLGMAEPGAPFMSLLKSDAATGGRTNRGGLDIVGFHMLPNADGDHTLQIVVADDKAVNVDTLDSVSAMSGDRLRINLIVAAAEITQRATALQATGTPEMQALAANAQRAAGEMFAAAARLRGLPIPPASDELATQAYHQDVARILAEHHIALVITSEYGSIKRLQEWMTRQGIRTYPEYLRWLQRRQGAR